ncbi:MAG TPA: hypothetical protein VHY35_07280 [Stellaceae bacterium]|nr:hypothetical protein [Stellaceae bacterium]
MSTRSEGVSSQKISSAVIIKHRHEGLRIFRDRGYRRRSSTHVLGRLSHQRQALAAKLGNTARSGFRFSLQFGGGVRGNTLARGHRRRLQLSQPLIELCDLAPRHVAPLRRVRVASHRGQSFAR